MLSYGIEKCGRWQCCIYGRGPTPSVRHAFVVQFAADTQVEADQVRGRIEHIVSGRATHFQSLEELLAFVARVFREGGKGTFLPPLK
jgi:hypothetical protein